MMYHSRQFIKQAVTVSQRTTGVRQVAKAAQRIMLVGGGSSPHQQMGMFTVNNSHSSGYKMVMQQSAVRQFSLPAH